jgi:hypothetical protein
MTFTSMTKKKFAAMSRTGSDDMVPFDKFAKQRERSGGGGGGSGGSSSGSSSGGGSGNGGGRSRSGSSSAGGSSSIEKTSSAVSSTSSGGRFQAWGGMGEGMDDLDAWLEGGDGSDDDDDEDGEGDEIRELPDVMNNRPLRVMKKSQSLDVQSTIQLHKKIPLIQPMESLLESTTGDGVTSNGSSGSSMQQKKTRPPPAPKF